MTHWRGSIRWRNLRAAVLARDGHQCNQCGRASELEAHHVDPVANGGQRWEVDNLVTLCNPCHRNEHGGLYLTSAVDRRTRREWVRRLRGM